jgi:chromosome segregation ATPase
LVQVKAWVRTKASSNALRHQRKRDRQAAEGRSQVNVVVPEECKEPLKELAQAIADGRVSADDVRRLIAGQDDRAEAAEKAAAAHKEEAASLRAELAAARAAQAKAEEEMAAAKDDWNRAWQTATTEHERIKAQLASVQKAAEADRLHWQDAVTEATEQVHQAQADRAAATKARTVAEAETAQLRAALEAQTLRARLARWLVRV